MWTYIWPEQQAFERLWTGSNQQYVQIQQIAVADVNICHAKKLILEDRQTAVCYIASTMCIKCWKHTIIHEHNVQESAHTVAPKDTDVWPESIICFCVCLTSEPVSTTRETRFYSEEWLVTRYGYTISLQIQRGPVWKGATKDPHHPKKLKTHAFSWQYHGKHVQRFRNGSSCQFSAASCKC